MSEVIFVVEEALEGGYLAQALGESIFEADSLSELQVNARDAVRCHFNPDNLPRMIRFHFVREELIAV